MRKYWVYDESGPNPVGEFDSKEEAETWARQNAKGFYQIVSAPLPQV